MAEPSITVRATFSDTARGGNLPVTRVVIHATAGGQGYPSESRAGVAHATALYFAGRKAGGSAHYIMDASGAEEHCVPDDVVAYHAPPNKGSIGIEICAEPSYTREQWLSPQVWPAVQAAARRARELCDRYGLPRTRLLPADLLAGQHGVCAHVDVSNAWHQSTHWDTGPNFPWPEFMAEVNAQPTPSPSPTPSEEDDMPQAVTTQIKTGERAVFAFPPAGPGAAGGAAGWGRAWFTVLGDRFGHDGGEIHARIAIRGGDGSWRPAFGTGMAVTLPVGRAMGIQLNPGDNAAVFSDTDGDIGVCVEYARA